MTNLFTIILNMSITASYVALAVIAARFLLIKLPKIFSYVLWLPVLIRLVCPFSFSSAFSFLNFLQHKPQTGTGTMEYVPYNIGFMQNPAADVGIGGINNAVNSYLPSATPTASVNPMQMVMEFAGVVWIAGMALLLIYSIVSCLKVMNKVKTATLVRDNIYETDSITTPFVWGFIKPRIIIPAGMNEDELSYILTHEQTHIRRLDYLVKPFAFLVLIVHWFNPLMWLSFALMGRDMEMSCDENVLKKMGNDIKGSYSHSLLSLSVRRSGLLMGSPLAFGESSIKSRIKNILTYKRPEFWVIAVAAIITVALMVSFTANPKDQPLTAPNTSEYDAEALIVGKTPYVGNNSKVISLIDAMPLPAGIVRDTVELHTASPPYGITINLIMDGTSKVRTMDKDTFYKNSILLFSLIDNADTINWNIPDNSNNYHGTYPSLTFTREMAEKLAGGDVRSYADSAGTLKDLIALLDNISFKAVQTPKDAQIEEYLEIIMSSPKTSSNPQDYIDAHPDAYENIKKIGGDDALQYMLSQFEAGNAAGLRGHIMMALCKDLLGDRNNVTDESLSPQEWFSRLAPYEETKLPDFRANVSDPVEQLVYDAAVKQYSRPDRGFTVVAPTIFGSYEEENKLRIFVTVFSMRYRLYDKTLSETGGSIVPAAITYTKNADGSYTLDEYLEAMDGAHFSDSIKEYCVMPVSKKEINGLHNKIMKDYGSNKDRSELLMKNLVQHLKSNGLEDIVLKRVTDELIPLT